ncbi:MAG: UDP-glucose--hexose-1-phosphate uridylyltransferase [Oscillospiraceae bacterium]|nr:UDP-glucose--hexose-1-phosphate uridylyltransferase [Oscillospiraceae bacterium]
MADTLSIIKALVAYAVSAQLITEEDRTFCINALLDIAHAVPSEDKVDIPEMELPWILGSLVEDAVKRGVIEDDTESRDIFDTRLMAALTPFPHEVRDRFREKYAVSPQAATEWYYSFSKATNYIRTDRIKKDRKWIYEGKYGALDITINLAKPEKDPKAIAKARKTLSTNYPACQLCMENEGYAGRIGHPARGNHRLIPLELNGEDWFLQYSPYSYYSEHCIAFNSRHIPMKVDRAAFRKLLDFVTLFPHYFIGSNADLPIVGGSILSHDHFQGGRYEFAMARAEVEEELNFEGYEDVRAGIVAWPMSVIRLRGKEADRLTDLADNILKAWRAYSDPSVFVFAETDGEPHNTITPIARRRGSDYELDLVLRNNITTEEHPLGLFHPHAKLHHIKKENIGLIEVMGLAVLPSRLKNELEEVKKTLVSGEEPKSSIALHAEWMNKLREKYSFTEDNADQIIQNEVGAVFERVLEDAGVFKRTPEGKEAFLRFTASVRA